jgi:hypothetical protein
MAINVPVIVATSFSFDPSSASARASQMVSVRPGLMTSARKQETV